MALAVIDGEREQAETRLARTRRGHHGIEPAGKQDNGQGRRASHRRGG
jgi:hypothetical protein